MPFCLIEDDEGVSIGQQKVIALSLVDPVQYRNWQEAMR